ncbi:MAG: 50S ribosomal protein L6 [Candidatus Levybacteria bacterium RIFOXYA1_FULL_41_10]|nr:MAG: 50S ribosomal protein L6 [Candidatus Levybacteria bacterium GW2011_GWA1_39_34]KKR50654.1 MAG: 50S ribosomal protein L6 [Candidatus Levybacteria bacterium GW2011_GWC1_40_19]KKR72533.1 MAG: 50S ribosomal protein L6 [Candidatus Levybacteria bacterium GW2011_GWC2_40_7]KKR95339.1 MAG: 50S ribosomal protein L6 [Candidatus Levybacteria bacterium GW2011_GWA2_41_15]KKS01852.1 MAG: 50S ribosomal protein L6 [Candidatus Levybacteria bacterium GW2011_GWB1_41_21]OGH20229.1 MAG: 50S ribosomal protein
MSKIAKKPVQIVEGTSVSFINGEVNVTGPKGSLTFKVPAGVGLVIEEKEVRVKQKDDSDTAKELAGLLRATVANMITGVSKGFEKKLELSGVGYRAQASGSTLTLAVGLSHPVIINADQSITFGVEENVITVSGMDKTLVGDISAKIRMIRPPEPYKGKGIKYQGERIRRKVGKAAKAVGATK